MNIHDLRLGSVKALLEQAGWTLPDAERVGETGFVQGLIDALCELSTRDALTGAMNRRAFNTQLAGELDRVARSGESSLFLMIDIDHFKQVNDRYGHLAGDAVIRAIGQTLLECVRPMDTVARFGGEEFAVVLPNCQSSFAEVVAERIRARVQDMSVQIPDADPISVTVSCGGAFALPWLRTQAEEWVGRADAQLYRAKASGRNTVCIDPLVVTEVSAEEKGLLFGLTSDDPGMMETSAGDR